MTGNTVGMIKPGHERIYCRIIGVKAPIEKFNSFQINSMAFSDENDNCVDWLLTVFPEHLH